MGGPQCIRVFLLVARYTVPTVKLTHKQWKHRRREETHSEKKVFVFIYKMSRQQELALYSSFEEEKSEFCVFCGREEENSIEFGKKLTYEDVTVHHFCLVSICNCKHFYSDWKNGFIENLLMCCSNEISVLQLLSANLKKTNEDDSFELFGFSVEDVKKEIARAAKLVCSSYTVNKYANHAWT